jgi:hypothetical protein
MKAENPIPMNGVAIRIPHTIENKVTEALEKIGISNYRLATRFDFIDGTYQKAACELEFLTPTNQLRNQIINAVLTQPVPDKKRIQLKTIELPIDTSRVASDMIVEDRLPDRPLEEFQEVLLPLCAGKN